MRMSPLRMRLVDGLSLHWTGIAVFWMDATCLVRWQAGMRRDMVSRMLRIFLRNLAPHVREKVTDMGIPRAGETFSAASLADHPSIPFLFYLAAAATTTDPTMASELAEVMAEAADTDQIRAGVGALQMEVVIPDRCSRRRHSVGVALWERGDESCGLL
ncbi:hypothetical protein ACQJBY_071230 [Aegilops geniculata]